MEVRIPTFVGRCLNARPTLWGKTMKTIREHVDFAYPLSKCPKPLVVDMVDDYIWLVVWNIWIIFHFILGMSSSQLTNSYFSRWLKPPTT